MHLRMPRQPLQVLTRLQAGPMLMVPLNIDTVAIDFATLTLSVVHRVLIPGDVEVRKLELGTWEHGEHSDVAPTVLGADPHKPQPV